MTSTPVVIIDYGIGNLKSIQNMVKKVGGKAEISSDPEKIKNAEKLILPGVGAFDQGMSTLRDSGLIDVLNKEVIDHKKCILGICLGAQIMTRGSEEGQIKGLGWFDADTIKFNFPSETSLKIPHMGWNEIKIKKNTPLTSELSDDSRFYFVHSYHFKCDNNEDVLTESRYGYNFTSAMHRGNIYAAQFHPEKSHKFGMTMMKNFLNLQCEKN